MNCAANLLHGCSAKTGASGLELPMILRTSFIKLNRVAGNSNDHAQTGRAFDGVGQCYLCRCFHRILAGFVTHDAHNRIVAVVDFISISERILVLPEAFCHGFVDQRHLGLLEYLAAVKALPLFT